jgi:hypothetical protein
MYLTAVMDWWSRFMLAWKFSNTLEVAFCVQAWHPVSSGAVTGRAMPADIF